MKKTDEKMSYKIKKGLKTESLATDSKINEFTPPDPLELIVFDFDGVFTDNKVYTSQDGVEAVMCDRRDGLGIAMLKELNIPMFILSTETNPVVITRGKKMGLKVHHGRKNKKEFLTEYFQKHNINSKNVIYVGNDINDFEAMKLVGYSVCPRDAHQKIKEVASYVLNDRGGDGAVRELSELLIFQKED